MASCRPSLAAPRLPGLDSQWTEPASRRACLLREPGKIRQCGAEARLARPDIARRTALLGMLAELAGKNPGFRHVARGNRQARRSANRFAYDRLGQELAAAHDLHRLADDPLREIANLLPDVLEQADIDIVCPRSRALSGARIGHRVRRRHLDAADRAHRDVDAS